MEERPPLNSSISVDDFQNFYWLKKELVDFCRQVGLSKKGGKIEISNRIVRYLKTGKKIEPLNVQRKKPLSNFDWKKAHLSVATIITDNYANTQNVRIFFKQNINQKFKFSVAFMNWMKANTGKTLADAIVQWYIIQEEQKRNTTPKVIAPQFEYNTYLPDFLADNPDSNREEAIAHWKIKRARRGDNRYQKSDLDFLK